MKNQKNKLEGFDSLDDLVNLASAEENQFEKKSQKKITWYTVPEDFDFWGGINLSTNFEN